MDIMQNYTITYINREDYDRDTGVYGEAHLQVSARNIPHACWQALLKMVQDVDYDADGTPQPYYVKLIGSLEDIVMVELA